MKHRCFAKYSAVLMAALFAAALPAHAAIINWFGPVGIARYQTARLSVLIGDPNIFGFEDPNEIPPGPCRVTVAFLANGVPVTGRDGRALTATFDLTAGQERSLDLAWEAFAAQFDAGARRMTFSAGVRAIGDPGITPDPCQNLSLTLEMIDNFTGRTLWVVARVTEPDGGD